MYAAISFAGIGGHTWTDSSWFEYIRSSSNFVPFKTIRTYIAALLDGHSKINAPIKSFLGNLMIYLQTGFLLPYFIKKLNKVRQFMLSITTLLLIVEVTQLVTRRGRFDIDELILNMLGALIGYSIWKTKRVQRFIKKLT